MDNFDVVPTNVFKKNFRKIKKNSRWANLLKKKYPENRNITCWNYVLTCFLKGIEIPEYFYAHPFHPKNSTIKNLRKKLSNVDVNPQVMDLHIDGKYGDHVLIYSIVREEKKVFLINIGTHSELKI